MNFRGLKKKSIFFVTVEAGLIAQEILEIPELSFVVSGGNRTNTDLSGVETTEPDTYAVDYNSINAYHIAATQELEAIVSKQADLIAKLEARLTALEN